MGDWIEWNGGAMPVGGDADVEYVLRDGYEDTTDAASLDWNQEGNNGDIVKYRVVA